MSDFPKQRDGIALERGRTDAVLIDEDGSRLCALNATALALWDLCDGETSIAEMVDAICRLCALTEEQAASDVRVAFDEFSALGVIEWA